jgi:hypothetical protein
VENHFFGIMGEEGAHIMFQAMNEIFASAARSRSVEKTRILVPFSGDPNVESLTPESQVLIVNRLDILSSKATEGCLTSV